MKINIIGVPLNLGCDREGVEMAPNVLREHGMLSVVKLNGHKVYDLGNQYIPQVSDDDKFAHHSNMKYHDEIVEVNNNLAEIVYSTVKSGAFPLVVGGDHSVGLGSVSGVKQAFENLGIIWIDAHGDLNTAQTTPSGNIHGMILSALMGIGDEALVNLYSKGNKVKPENVFLIGTRSLDTGEKELVRKTLINHIPMVKLRKLTIENVIQQIHDTFILNKVENVHLSIDIDSIDPEVAPGTGTKVKNGFTKEEFLELVGSVVDMGFVRSVDIVEFNPLLDTDNITAKLCIEIIDLITKRLNKNRF
ncbi:MAG: arginase [Rikenellaceae bacterium]